MKKHRPRIKKPVKKITNSRSKVISAEPNNGAPAYYHGGAPHLIPGDYILPRTETGHQPRRGADWETDPVLYCDDLVYFTTNLEAAAFYAAWHRSRCGQVYVVAPEGEITPDPDYS